MPKMPIGPKRLPFFDHVAELRKRLAILVATLITASLALYTPQLSDPIWNWLLAPIQKAYISIYKTGVFKPIVIGPFETFTFRFKVAFFAAIVLTSPIIIWQFMAFFLPALKKNERKWFTPTFFAAVAFFLAGALFARYVILYPAFQFMFAQGGDMVGVVPYADKYMTGIGLLLVGFGIAFELPILVFYAIGFGLIPYKKLRENWRYVYAGLAIVAAVATPDWSPVTMGLLGGALIVLYEGSLILSRIVFAKRIKAAQMAEPEAA